MFINQLLVRLFIFEIFFFLYEKQLAVCYFLLFFTGISNQLEYNETELSNQPLFDRYDNVLERKLLTDYEKEFDMTLLDQVLNKEVSESYSEDMDHFFPPSLLMDNLENFTQGSEEHEKSMLQEKNTVSDLLVFLSSML